MKRHHFLIAIHSLAFVAASLLAYNYLHLDGLLFNPVITYENRNSQTEHQTYRPGDTVDGVETFCMKRNVEIEVNYFLVDTYIRSYPTKYLHVPVGCYDEKLYEMIPLPTELHGGAYHIEAQYTVHLNPVNTIQWTRVSNDFEVVK